MLLDKANLAVHKAASKDETRPQLTGIRVEPDGSTVATDGYILAKVAPCGISESEYPIIPGTCSDRAENGESPTRAPIDAFTIPASDAKVLEKALPRKAFMPILKHVLLDETATQANGHAVFATTDLESPTIRNVRKIEGTYPAYDKVLPGPNAYLKNNQKEPIITIGLDAALLANLAEVAATCAETNGKCARPMSVTLEIRDAVSAIVVRSMESDRFYGIIMPLRID